LALPTIWLFHQRRLCRFLSSHDSVRVPERDIAGKTKMGGKCIALTVHTMILILFASVHLPSSHMLSTTLKIKISITIILRVVLHGCETWSLALREEHTILPGILSYIALG
jgi:hypothetical protein